MGPTVPNRARRSLPSTTLAGCLRCRPAARGPPWRTPLTGDQALAPLTKARHPRSRAAVPGRPLVSLPERNPGCPLTPSDGFRRGDHRHRRHQPYLTAVGTSPAILVNWYFRCRPTNRRAAALSSSRAGCIGQQRVNGRVAGSFLGILDQELSQKRLERAGQSDR